MGSVAAEEDRAVAEVRRVPVADAERRDPCQVEQPHGLSRMMMQERLELSQRRRLHRLLPHGDLAHRDQAPALIREGKHGEEVVRLGVDGGFIAC